MGTSSEIQNEANSGIYHHVGPSDDNSQGGTVYIKFQIRCLSSKPSKICIVWMVIYYTTAVLLTPAPSLPLEVGFNSLDGKLPRSTYCQCVLVELSSNQHPTPTTLSLERRRCGCSWLLGGSWFWLLLRMIQWRIQWIQHYHVSHLASAAYSFSCSTGLENLDSHAWGPTWKGSCPRKPSIGWKAPYCSGYILRDTKRSQQWNLPSCWSIRWQFPGGYCVH